MSTPSKPSAIPISSSSASDLEHFVDIITSAFESTALTTAFICAIDSTPPPYPSPLITPTRRHRHFSQGILDSASANAELVQAGDWSAIALWEPATFKGTAFIDSKNRPGELLAEWRGKVLAAKRKYLGLHADSATAEDVRIRPFYHLSFLARNPARPRVAGAIEAVITPFLERARQEGVPAWLEATTPQAARIYEHYGFRVVEVITVGKGKIDALGWPKEGGEGVTAYAMICDGHLTDEQKPKDVRVSINGTNGVNGIHGVNGVVQ